MKEREKKTDDEQSPKRAGGNESKGLKPPGNQRREGGKNDLRKFSPWEHGGVGNHEEWENKQTARWEYVQPHIEVPLHEKQKPVSVQQAERYQKSQCNMQYTGKEQHGETAQKNQQNPFPFLSPDGRWNPPLTGKQHGEANTEIAGIEKMLFIEGNQKFWGNG